MNVRLLGPLPTPGVAYLTKSLRGQFGVVISASHNDFHDNGIKIFSADGVKISREIEKKIEKVLATELMPVPTSKQKYEIIWWFFSFRTNWNEEKTYICNGWLWWSNIND